MTFNILVIQTQEAHSGDTLLLDCVRRVHVYHQHQQQMKIGLWQDHKLEIVGAGNVTLKGDEECAVGVEECILALWHQPAINFKTGSHFLVNDSSHYCQQYL